MGTNPIATPASTTKPAFTTAKSFLGRKRRLEQLRTGPSGALTPRCREPLPADHRSCASGPGQRHGEELAEGDPRRGPPRRRSRSRDCRRSKDRKAHSKNRASARQVQKRASARQKDRQGGCEESSGQEKARAATQGRVVTVYTLPLRTRRKSWGRGQFRTGKLTLIL